MNEVARREAPRAALVASRPFATVRCGGFEERVRSARRQRTDEASSILRRSRVRQIAVPTNKRAGSTDQHFPKLLPLRYIDCLQHGSLHSRSVSLSPPLGRQRSTPYTWELVNMKTVTRARDVQPSAAHLGNGSVRESDDGYRRLVEGLPAAIYTCDLEGRVLFYNRTAAALWGREPRIGVDLWCGSWWI